MAVRSANQRTLRLIEFSLLRTDPQLVTMLNVFSRLTAGQGMPAWEQVPSAKDRAGEAAALIEMARVIVVAAVGLMVRRVGDLGSAVMGRASSRTRPFKA